MPTRSFQQILEPYQKLNPGEGNEMVKLCFTPSSLHTKTCGFVEEFFSVQA